MDPSEQGRAKFPHATICRKPGRMTKVTKEWAHGFSKKSQSLLLDVESKINNLLVGKLVGSLSNIEETSLKALMAKRQDILVYKETKWHLKSRTIWLKEEDNNTMFFHRYVTYQKRFNSVWEIKDQTGKLVNCSERIVEARKEFYTSLFKEPKGFPIEEIIKVVNLFP